MCHDVAARQNALRSLARNLITLTLRICPCEVFDVLQLYCQPGKRSDGSTLWHQLVQRRVMAKVVGRIVSINPELVEATAPDGRTAYDLATREVRGAIDEAVLFCGRCRMPDSNECSLVQCRHDVVTEQCALHCMAGTGCPTAQPRRQT